VSRPNLGTEPAPSERPGRLQRIRAQCRCIIKWLKCLLRFLVHLFLLDLFTELVFDAISYQLSALGIYLAFSLCGIFLYAGRAARTAIYITWHFATFPRQIFQFISEWAAWWLDPPHYQLSLSAFQVRECLDQLLGWARPMISASTQLALRIETALLDMVAQLATWIFGQMVQRTFAKQWVPEYPGRRSAHR